MSQTIPTINEPFYTLRARLDDRDYTLEFLYSPRQERYYLSLFDTEGEPLVLGLKLVTNLPLLRFYHFRENVPSGDLIVTCTTTNKSPPKLGELGKGLRCELTYFTRDELAEVVASLNA